MRGRMPSISTLPRPLPKREGGYGIASKCIEDVGDGDDARRERELVALQPVGAAFAVRSFVMLRRL